MIGVFSVNQASAVEYYVNDASTNGDVYCSAVGSDATGTGTNAATPYLTLTNLLVQKDLEPGDTVYIDTGTYGEYEVRITAGDGGGSGNPVVFRGSTNVMAGGTVLDRGGSGTIIDLRAEYVELYDLHLFDGSRGLWVREGYNYFENIETESCTFGFVEESSNNTYYRCSALSNGTGFDTLNPANVKWDSGLSYRNTVAFDNVGNMPISNSVIVSGTAFTGSGPSIGDHNLFWNTTLHGSSTYDTLLAFQEAKDGWWHSILAQPGFADASGGDFHPRSVAGRYDPSTGAWVTDSVHSVLIDFASPDAEYAHEPSPNGGRANAGIFGNSVYASKSRTNAWLLALTGNDGGAFSGTNNPLYWKFGNFSNGATVRIQYSQDLGATWSNVVSGLAVTNTPYVWDVTGLDSTAIYWRVQSESAPFAADPIDQRVSLNGGAVYYYVNDGSTSDDVYCSAEGMATNSGLSPGQPKLTLTNMLATYAFGGRDVIFVDTGLYTNQQTTISSDDSGGSESERFSIRGAGPYKTVIRLGGSGNPLTVQSRYTGIEALAIVTGSRGIRAYASDCVYKDVHVRLCTIGIAEQSDGNNIFLRCVVADNGRGVEWTGSPGNRWDRGICYGNTRAFVDMGSTPISNSIIVGGTAFDGAGPSVGDYNILWNSTFHDDIDYGTLVEFQKANDVWWNSIYADPLFADAASEDYHPKSTVGRYDQATESWVTDAVHSVAIDFAFPGAAYTNEPVPNGSRMNAGIYGNTSQASKSSTNASLLTLTYNDGGTLNPNESVYWNSYNMATDELVRIEYSGDGGETWAVIESNLSAGAGSYAWSYTNFSSSRFARWRVVVQADTNIWDGTDTNFIWRNGPFVYYVNDSSPVGDIYTDALGLDSNLGTTPTSPKQSLQSVLDDHDIEPGDIIYIDTGHYELSGSQVLGGLDQGNSSNLVRVVGSTNEVNGGTRINGANLSPALNVGADYVHLSYLTVTNAKTGIRLSSSVGTRLSWIRAINNTEIGISVEGSPDVRIDHSALVGNRNTGIYAGNSDVAVANVVVITNKIRNVHVASGLLTMSNSVVFSAGKTAYGYYAAGTTNIVGDFNNLFAIDGAVVGYIESLGRRFDSHGAWSAQTGQEGQSLSVDPVFANMGRGDFHLKTQTSQGRYEPGVGWVLDAVTSPLIDAGDPSATFTNEPAPNGGRANIGKYGNTGQASKRGGAGWLHAASFRQGGSTWGTSTIHWVAGNAATGHQVKIEYSGDGGLSWAFLSTGTSASAEALMWDTTETNDTPAGLWRITSLTDSNLSDVVTNFLAVRNADLSIYVNDASTNNDVYCTAVGTDSNWVAEAGKPLDALWRVFRHFDVEPGDRILVDAGTYTTAVETIVGRLDSGTLSDPVLLLGSTNRLQGNTILKKEAGASATYGLFFDTADGIVLSNVVVEGWSRGVGASASKAIRLDHLWARKNSSHGVEFTSSTNVQMNHLLSANNVGRGYVGDGSRKIQIAHSVLWSNALGAISLDSGSVEVSNSVLTASGSGRYVLEGDGSPVVRSDYNTFLAEEGAYISRIGLTISKQMSRWRAETGNDLRTLTHTPLFVDPSTYDFHLQSEAGTYASSGWTNYSDSSPLIDAGGISASFAYEPSPDGGRVNIGLYGNTDEASKSSTNAGFLALTLNDGGTVRGTNTLYWTAKGAATGHLVYVEYSHDGGSSWTNIATNVNASVGQVLWDTTKYKSSAGGLWRIVSQSDSNVIDITDNQFFVKNEPLSYYVNDSSTNGDIYATAAGNADYDGRSPDFPVNSIQRILELYELDPGDRILVDTGTYTVNQLIRFDQDVSGVATNPIVIRGSTNEAFGGTVLDCQGATRAMEFYRTQSVRAEHFNIINAQSEGVRFYQSTNCAAYWIDVQGGNSCFEVLLADRSALRHCIARGARTNGLNNLYSSDTTWEHGVSWSNRYAFRMGTTRSIGAPPDNILSVSNSIVGVLGAGDYAYEIANGSFKGDYNNIWISSNAYVAREPGEFVPQLYLSVSRWARDTGNDLHSLTKDPLFVDSAGGNFRLQSAGGRYDVTNGVFVEDAVTSPLIDAGNPSCVFSNESAMNGGRLNIGRYGNSWQASRTPTNSMLAVVSLDDGGRVEGTKVLHWTRIGNATGHVLNVDYSWDGGSSWLNLAEGILPSANSYAWDTTAVTSSLFGVWRVVSSNEPAVKATSTVYFAVRNTPFYFYVNDANTNGDVYTTAGGLSTNLGISRSFPKASIQNLVDSWDLEEGDIIWVDTGTYTNQGVLEIGQHDGGEGASGHVVTLQGSTNVAAGGTVMKPSDATVGIRLSGLNDFAVKHIAVQDAKVGVKFLQSANCLAQWVTVEGGQVAYDVEYARDISIEHCSANGATDSGLRNASASNVFCDASVMWTYGTAVSVGRSTNFVKNRLGRMGVSNSVLRAKGDGEYIYRLENRPSSPFYADYNAVVVANGSLVGREWDATNTFFPIIYDSLSRWVRDTSRDRHSLTDDPLFVDADGGDFHLKSVAGHFVSTSGLYVVDAVTSPLIDAGSPDDVFTNETVPNGLRRNIGLYGNTAQASKTPTNSALVVISLNDGGRAEGTNWPLRWIVQGDATGHTVSIEFSDDAGDTWDTVVTGWDASTGEYGWNTTTSTSTLQGVWRITSDDEVSIQDESEVLFAVRNSPISFFVNDLSTNGDVYCTAAGQTANTGLTPSEPKRSLSALLAAWDLEPGDTVFIDTGVYTNTSPIVFDQFDTAGVSNANHVVIQGSTNVIAGGTRQLFSSGIKAFDLTTVGGLTLKDLVIDGALQGVHLETVEGCRFEALDIKNTATGVEITDSKRIYLQNCVIRNAGDKGLYVASGERISWTHGVLWSNRYGVYFDQGTLGFSNSVIGAFGSSAYAYYQKPTVDFEADYNAIFLTNGAAAMYRPMTFQPQIFFTVSRMVRDLHLDRHSLSHNPLFADSVSGDFHLMSRGGRYDPATGAFTNDNLTSPLIDAGSPASAWTNELSPNGGRVNIGLYGNTDQASMTPTNRSLTALSLNDGGRAEVTKTLFWLARGDATADTVRLEYSSDAGNSWLYIETNLMASSGFYVWDTRDYTSSIRGLWRIVSEADTNVYDTTDSLFALRNDPLSFYVNNASTNGDVYTTAAGSPLNLGVTPNAPADSVQDVLDTWDLEPGDTVYIDTGDYTIGADISITRYDAWSDFTNLTGLASGLDTNSVTLTGSTNAQGGGTVINRFGGGNVILVDTAPGVRLQHMTLRGGAAGVRMQDSDYGRLAWVRSEGATIGFDVEESDQVELAHCVASENSGTGLRCVGPIDVAWQSGVFWSNRVGAYFYDEDEEGQLQIQNSVVGSFGSNAFGFVRIRGDFVSDYNAMHLVNGAFAGGESDTFSPEGRTNRFESVHFWWRATGQDEHTLSQDPLFADANAGDFHLKTTRMNGRYDAINGEWTNDTEFSRLIDSGNPNSSFLEEPAPRGNRINIGLYGNTDEASKPPTNSWLTIITLNDLSSVQGDITLRWVAGGLATSHIVNIEFSPLAGLSWTNVVTNYPAGNEYYVWDTTNFGKTVAGLWRITSLNESNATDTSDVFFTMRENEGTIPFFVNDGSTNGDVYCTAAGSSTNLGIVPYAPVDNIQSIFDSFKLEPYDVVYVDTGVYPLDEDLVVGDLDSGFGTNYVTIQGSTNYSAGGTLLDRQVGGGEADVIELSLAEGIALRDLRLRNGRYGVMFETASDCTLHRIRSQNNVSAGFALASASGIEFLNCIAWNNQSNAGVIAEASSMSWENGVIWDNGTAVELVDSGPVTFHNTILQAAGLGSRIFVLDKETDIASIEGDYNNFVIEDGAYIAEKENLVGGNDIYGRLIDWQRSSDEDSHSLGHDPLFANENNGDFHLRSSAGRWVTSGVWTNDLTNSPCIDAGDPAAMFSDELAPNGNRINIGAYGNTGVASLSRTNPWLVAVSLNSGGLIFGTNNLVWNWGGMSNGSMVRLEHSRNNGIDWHVIASNVVNSSTGYMWDASSEPPVARGLWRVISEASSGVVDVVDQPYAIKNNPITLYVNDSSTNGDVYCSVVGNNANSGLSSGAPLADPSIAFTNYPITGGDTIYIDTGTYAINNDLFLNELNRGFDVLPIKIHGSTNMAAGGTVINRNNAGRPVLYLRGARFVQSDYLKFTGGKQGLLIEDALSCAFDWLEIFGNSGSGFKIDNSDPHLTHCAAWNNNSWGLEAAGVNAAPSFDQGVLWSNTAGGIRLSRSYIGFSNSIVHAAGEGHFIYAVDAGTLESDWNFITIGDGADLAADLFRESTYKNLQEWQSVQGVDAHSVLAAPMFVDASAGDFHLQSEAGTYSNGVWGSHTNTSWAIDAGALSAPYGVEPSPNGGRLNVGLYGNTREASKSLTNVAAKALLAVSLNDGGVLNGNKLLYWLSRGMQSTSRVTLRYSDNGGADWKVITNNLPAISSGYLWDISSLTSSPLTVWEVMDENDTNIRDRIDRTFVLRNGPIPFYVNDMSTNGDVYTTAIGVSTNIGLTPFEPKASVQDVLDSYDLEGGDTLFVDTGLYYLTNGIVVENLDSGLSTARVSIVGSTNYNGGGTVFRGVHTSYVDSTSFHLSACKYVHLGNFTVENSDIGILCDNSVGEDNIISNVLVRDWGKIGLNIRQQSGLRVLRSAIVDGQGTGVYVNVSDDNTIDQSVIWNNGGDAAYIENGSLSVSNSVLSARRLNKVCVYLATNAFYQGDYNNLFTTNGALCGVVRAIPTENLSQWNQSTTQDVHSYSVDPAFADPSSNDYHLKSEVGRYELATGMFVTDTVTSLLIDGGNPGRSASMEPSPNGSRLNIGLYGNTHQASKSLTNAWMIALTASGGGRLNDTFYLAWNAGGGLSATNRVRIDYSDSNGSDWTNLASSLPITQWDYLWNSAGELSPIARWRVVLEANTNVYDETDEFFALNGPFTFYVNDSVTNDDVYTEGLGALTNLGFYVDQPMASIKDVLDTYDLEGEDSILVDTGMYDINTNTFVVFGLGDQGNDSYPVFLKGNTNEPATVLVWDAGGLTNDMIIIQGQRIQCEHLVLEGGSLSARGQGTFLGNLVVTNGDITLEGKNQIAEDISLYNGTVSAAGKPLTLQRLRVADGAIRLVGTNVLLQHSVVYGNSDPAVSAIGSSLLIENNTLVGNGSQLRLTGFGNATVRNNIMVAEGANNVCIEWAGGTLNSDYNNLVARNGAWIGARGGFWEKLLYWQKASGEDMHSMSANPLFADESGRDYYLKSITPNGRWNGTTWTNDSVHSSSIDAGRPSSTWSNEPSPNGGRVNMGAYGGTDKASKSRTNEWLLALTMNDGGVLKGTNIIRWVAGGIASGETVRIEYSSDGGSSWITNATGVDAVGGQYTWDTTDVASSLNALWRVVLESDDTVLDPCDSAFAVRNVPLDFFVNDGVDPGDVYTTAAGSPANDGLTASTPKDSIQAILDAYDTEALDTIKIDTGVYSLTSDVWVIWSRGGDEDYGNLIIQGSTNVSAGGSVIVRGSTANNRDAFDVPASHVTLRDLAIRQAYAAVRFDSNRYSSAERLLVYSNRYGILADKTRSLTVSNVRAWNNTEGGVFVKDARTTRVANVTFVVKTNYGVRIENTVNDRLQNNIYYLSGSNVTALSGPSADIDDAFIDYNVYYFAQTSSAIYGSYRNLQEWQLNEQHDYRSAITNPAFVNYAAGDFHLMSTGGAYSEATHTWVTNAESSWAIDKGNPYSDYDLEPEDDGERINIGAFGNTEYASIGSTNALIFARVLNEPTEISETNSVWPLIWTALNVPSYVKVNVQYSGDGGQSWANLATGLDAWREYYVWSTSPFYNTFNGLWRVIGETNGVVYTDTNDAEFVIFYGEFDISNVRQTGSQLNEITWRGAWGETYQVQYTTNIADEPSAWINAPTGAAPEQVPFFLSTQGGDFDYQDVESETNKFRLYRVIWYPSDP
jgi:hypothetical protein